MTAGVGKTVEDGKTAIQQEQEEMTNEENKGLTNRLAGKTFQVMTVAIRHGLGDFASLDDGEEGENEDDKETQPGQLNYDDKPG